MHVSKKDRQQYLAAVYDYVGSVLPPALFPADAINVMPAEGGRRSYVYFVEGAGRERFVLRGDPDRRSLKRRIRGHEILLRLGFQVPRIMYQDLNASTFEKYELYFVAETFIRGQYFTEATAAGAAGARLGEILSRMHEFTSWRYGWPGELAWKPNIYFGMKLMKKAQKQLKLYRRRSEETSAIISDWLRKQPLRAWFPKPRLTTGGFISTNVLVSEGNVSLIDLARVRYAFAARDIAQVQFGLTRHNKPAKDAFMQSYRQHASSNLLKELQTSLPLFELLFLLRIALKERDMAQYERHDQALRQHCGY